MILTAAEEWQHAAEYYEAELKIAKVELDRLRAAMELAERCHLEQATQWKAEIDRLRAEVERLQFEAENWCPDSHPCSCRAEIERLRAEVEARTGMTDLDADFYRDKAVIIAERDHLRDENTGLRSQIIEIRRVVESWRTNPPQEIEG